jgi:hypothetical protein
MYRLASCKEDDTRDARPASRPAVGGPEGDRCPPLPGYAAELARELGRVVRGDVPGARALYAYDASVFRQVPVGVVAPRDAYDVAAAIAACRRHGAPVLSRTCGTGLAGQTVNEAVCSTSPGT